MHSEKVTGHATGPRSSSWGRSSSASERANAAEARGQNGRVRPEDENPAPVRRSSAGLSTRLSVLSGQCRVRSEAPASGPATVPGNPTGAWQLRAPRGWEDGLQSGTEALEDRTECRLACARLR